MYFFSIMSCGAFSFPTYAVVSWSCLRVYLLSYFICFLYSLSLALGMFVFAKDRLPFFCILFQDDTRKCRMSFTITNMTFARHMTYHTYPDPNPNPDRSTTTLFLFFIYIYFFILYIFIVLSLFYIFF